MGLRRVVHVIDDETDVCEALKVLLHTAGFEARTYASAEEFLAEVNLNRPMCLLVDVRLPGMSGLELVRRLQQGPVRPVVVMITGHGDVPLAVKAMRAGALHFMEKPFEPEELLQTLEEALQRVSAMAAEEATSAAIEFELPVADATRTGSHGASRGRHADESDRHTARNQHANGGASSRGGAQEDGRADGLAPCPHEHEPAGAEFTYTAVGSHRNSGVGADFVSWDRGAALARRRSPHGRSRIGEEKSAPPQTREAGDGDECRHDPGIRFRAGGSASSGFRTQAGKRDRLIGDANCWMQRLRLPCRVGQPQWCGGGCTARLSCCRPFPARESSGAMIPWSLQPPGRLMLHTTTSAPTSGILCSLGRIKNGCGELQGWAMTRPGCCARFSEASAVVW